MVEAEAELINSTLDRALRITRQELGNVQLVDWEMGSLEIVAQRGFRQDFLDSFRHVSTRDGCACGRALLLRDTVVIDDVTTDRYFSPFKEIAERAGFRAVQSTPLVSSGGAVVGVISTHGGHSPNGRELEQIKSLAQETANELIRLRAQGVLKLAFAAERKSISNARNLVQEARPNAFVGVQHHDLISTQELAKPRD
jgi:GAF domain-containing protein